MYYVSEETLDLKTIFMLDKSFYRKTLTNARLLAKSYENQKVFLYKILYIDEWKDKIIFKPVKQLKINFRRN